MASAADVAVSTYVWVDVAETVEVVCIAYGAFMEGFAIQASLDHWQTGVAKFISGIQEILQLAFGASFETRALSAVRQRADLTMVGGLVDEFVEGTVAEIAKLKQGRVMVDEVVRTYHCIGHVVVTNSARVQGGAVAALVQVALLALTVGNVEVVVVLFVALVAEGEVVAEEAVVNQTDSAPIGVNVEEVSVGTIPGFYVEQGDALPC